MDKVNDEDGNDDKVVVVVVVVVVEEIVAVGMCLEIHHHSIPLLFWW